VADDDQITAGAEGRVGAADEWRTGDVVADLYKVLWKTQGGMGAVHRVHHLRWNIDLAVKTPLPEYVADAAAMRNFETEAETWVDLGLHPNVVACVYVRRLGGLPRVFAEWADGGSLSEAIASRGLYAGEPSGVLGRILGVAIQFAWGLEYAHSRRLVHQDVKPANVMLSADGAVKVPGDGWVKVSDFGLAQARAAAGEQAPAHEDTVPGSGYLTEAYCSPEQAAGGPAGLTATTDVWSWALSVWEMFTGAPPCRFGQSAAEAFAAFRQDPWVDDPAIPAMPAAVAELLTRCLQLDSALRPAFGELADELLAVHKAVLGEPYPVTKPEPAKLLADGLNNQALSMIDLGRMAEAENLWQQALLTDSQHLYATYNYGLHRWRHGRITDAQLIDHLQAVRIAQPSPEADRLLAQVHLERHDTTAARSLLTEAAHDACGDADIAAAVAVAQKQAGLAPARILTDSLGTVRSLALSADGQIALLAHESEVQVWDVQTESLRRALAGHTGGVSTVALNPNGRIAISGGDQTVRTWAVPVGACVRTVTGVTGGVSSVALSANAQTVAMASATFDTTVGIFDALAEGGWRLLAGHTGWVGSVALSADGQVAVSGSRDGTVRLWHVPRETCLHIFTGHTGEVKSVALSADGRIAVSGGDTTVWLWDVRTGSCLHTLPGHTDTVLSVALSADGRIAISGAEDATVRVWHVPTGYCLRTLTGHTNGILSVALSADGRSAISSSYDNTVRLWEVPTSPGYESEWSYVRPRSAQELLSAAAVVEAAARRAEVLLESGDGAGAAAQLRAARAIPGHQRAPRLMDLWGQLAALGRRGGLRDAWPRHTLQRDARVLSVGITADGRTAVSAGYHDRIWLCDVLVGTVLGTVCTKPGKNEVGPGRVALSADGRIVVSARWAAEVDVSDVSAGNYLRTFSGGPTEVLSVALDADGRTAVTGVSNGTIRVWDVPTGNCRHTLAGHSSDVRSLSLSDDGRIAASGSHDQTVRVWDALAGSCLQTLVGHNEAVWSVALSADARIAVSGSRDHSMRVWDVTTGSCLRVLSGHTGAVSAVALSADSCAAVSASDDETIRVWDVSTGECLHILTGHTGPVWSVALSADATVAVSGSEDRTVRIWVLDWEYEFPAESAARPSVT
jgi:WD40 repeat protein/serine/threonine protein kinase